MSVSLLVDRSLSVASCCPGQWAPIIITSFVLFPMASLLSGNVRDAERGAVAGELGRQLCSDREWCQKGRAGEVG